MYKIFILPEARKDIFEASQWYESQSKGLGAKFEGKIIAYVDSLRSDFIQHQKAYKELSRVFVKGFPYQIYF
jgi:hypothetical protein